MKETVRLARNVQIVLDIFLLLAMVIFFYIGIWIHTNSDPVIVLTRACAEDMSIPELLEITNYIFFCFSAMMLLLSAMGIIGALTVRPGLLQAYALLTYILLSTETLFITFLTFHLAHLENSLQNCLPRKITEQYQGPWVKDPHSLSHAIDKVQYEQQCCGIQNPRIYDKLTTWDRDTWDIPPDDFLSRHVDKGFSGVRPKLVIPWTCCQFNESVARHYDPAVKVAKLQETMKNPKCPYKLGLRLFTPCDAWLKAQISQGRSAIPMFGFVVVFLQVITFVLGAYGSKAIRNSALGVEQKERADLGQRRVELALANRKKQEPALTRARSRGRNRSMFKFGSRSEKGKKLRSEILRRVHTSAEEEEGGD